MHAQPKALLCAWQVTGRVVAAGGFGLRLRLAGGFAGAVGLCDIHDTYMANALAGTAASADVLLPAPLVLTSAAASGDPAAGSAVQRRWQHGGMAALLMLPSSALCYMCMAYRNVHEYGLCYVLVALLIAQPSAVRPGSSATCFSTRTMHAVCEWQV